MSAIHDRAIKEISLASINGWVKSGRVYTNGNFVIELGFIPTLFAIKILVKELSHVNGKSSIVNRYSRNYSLCRTHDGTPFCDMTLDQTASMVKSSIGLAIEDTMDVVYPMMILSS